MFFSPRVHVLIYSLTNLEVGGLSIMSCGIRAMRMSMCVRVCVCVCVRESVCDMWSTSSYPFKRAS